MPDRSTPDDVFGDIRFEELEEALRAGKGLAAWDGAFEEIVRRVVAAIRRRFPDSQLTEDATQSAWRTFLRRARDGQYELKGVSGMIGLLVVIAYRKAARRSREALRRPGQLDDDPPDRGGPEAAGEEESGRLALRAATSEQLRQMLDRVRRSLTPGLHQDLLPYWLARTYDTGPRQTREQVGRATGCSVATVDRVFREIEARWQPLLEEGRQAIAELRERLG